jgi:hypothetical protein
VLFESALALTQKWDFSGRIPIKKGLKKGKSGTRDKGLTAVLCCPNNIRGFAISD